MFSPFFNQVMKTLVNVAEENSHTGHGIVLQKHLFFFKTSISKHEKFLN